METNLSKLVGQFKHRTVRDLAWVIASPPLVSGQLDDVHWWSYDDCLVEFNGCLDALYALDLNPEPLNLHLANLKNSRLGSIFEGFISYWLKISPNYQELYQNIQLIEDKHTYGEIDFIIEEISSKKIIHLEVAVKFYLGCEPYADSYRWFGTNTKDQLGKKIDHLISHQTQLTQKHPEQVKKYCEHHIDAKHCFIKGRLFYPEGSDESPRNLSLDKNHLRGQWAFVDDSMHPNNIIHINKSHWLAELNTNDINDLQQINDKSLNTIDRAECFVECEKIDDRLVEKQRTFYLPNSFSFPKFNQ